MQHAMAGFKPTHADLRKIVLDGIPGTAMPSFKLLPDLEIEALVDYVKYLSIRGESERGMLMETTNLEEKQRLIEVPAKPDQLTRVPPCPLPRRKTGSCSRFHLPIAPA